MHRFIQPQRYPPALNKYGWKRLHTFPPILNHSHISRSSPHRLFFTIAAFRTHTIGVHCHSAERAAVYAALCFKLCRCCVHAACKCYFYNVQLVFQQVIDNLYHPFHGHCLLSHHKTGIRISSCQLCLEGLALHLVLRMAVLYALLFIHFKYGGEKGDLFALNQGSVGIL